jgi:hypothetical protein
VGQRVPSAPSNKNGKWELPDLKDINPEMIRAVNDNGQLEKNPNPVVYICCCV